MNKYLLLVLFLTSAVRGFTQVVTTDPVFPKPDQPLTITVDVTGTTINNFAWNNSTNPVWIWTWIADGCTSGCDAPTNVNPATPGQDAAKMTRISTNPDRYQITFTPTTFFNKPASQIKRIGIKVKSRDWADEKQSDNNRFIDMFEGFAVKFTNPSAFPVFKNSGEQIAITANASENTNLTLKINGSEVKSELNANVIAYTYNITETSGTSIVTVTGSNGGNFAEASFNFVIRTPTVNQSRPAGIIDGINYGSDATKVTLCLWAPGKSSVYVYGDFSNWTVLQQNQMKKDGERFWIELTGLTPGQEYGFQYLVDETIKMGDPYADKILDVFDGFIPSSIYPDLKPYPEAARDDKDFYSKVAVFQTAQEDYQWEVTNFQRPAKEKLVIYEVLIRDFFDEQNRSYKSLTDTISYFKRLGVNAIQLMPIMEFSGNDSWGYNPIFMFAPDKAYGPKNRLKQFIDECHKNGIAVILDIAMNHHDSGNPYVLMDFNPATGTVTSNNKWFNVSAKHPYNVFYDMNHESSYTKKYLDTVNYYWLDQYKIDGYRFDLTKGFTQNAICNGSATNEACINSSKDDSRIAILKRMGDKIWEKFPNSYLILEHFGVNDEEKELSNHGFMLWGNLNHSYNELTKGNGANISGVYHKSRGWSDANVVGYMESHDEERLMVRNLSAGKTTPTYNVRDVATSIDRIKAASVYFYTVPGPKMLWQFGELGYDISIDFNGRVGTKPVKWDYYEDSKRLELFNHTADLIRLKTTYSVFSSGDATFKNTGLVHMLTIQGNPFKTLPLSANEMNAQVVVNFDVVPKSVSVTFPHAGQWYDYYNNGAKVTLNTTATSFNLAPGEYKLFTDYPINGDELPPVSIEDKTSRGLQVYPNPTTGTFVIDGGGEYKYELVTSAGVKQRLKLEGQQFNVSHLPNGLYILIQTDRNGTKRFQKIVKR